jgi:hypothetical protein
MTGLIRLEQIKNGYRKLKNYFFLKSIALSDTKKMEKPFLSLK